MDYNTLFELAVLNFAEAIGMNVEMGEFSLKSFV
jgi:hypothetical protein